MWHQWLRNIINPESLCYTENTTYCPRQSGSAQDFARMSGENAVQSVTSPRFSHLRLAINQSHDTTTSHYILATPSLKNRPCIFPFPPWKCEQSQPPILRALFPPFSSINDKNPRRHISKLPKLVEQDWTCHRTTQQSPGPASTLVVIVKFNLALSKFPTVSLNHTKLFFRKCSQVSRSFWMCFVVAIGRSPYQTNNKWIKGWKSLKWQKEDFISFFP